MTCEEVRPLLGAFFDNEVSDIELSQKIQGHLETCGACARELEAMSHVSTSLRARPERFAIPANLEERIKEATGVSGIRDSITGPNFKWWRVFAAVAIPLAAAVVIGAGIMFILDRPRLNIERDLVADHVRSLQANHLFDVPSTDQHTVKPWFQGKLDFSPAVPQLAPQGFPLLGGRLDYVADHPAAALVYSRAKHIINVLVIRHLSGDLPNGVIDKDGYHVCAWQHGGLDYWAVSDVNPTDLQTFKTSFLAGS